jgi:predicted DsbA family dithiol-disulfide isomerase
MFLTLAVLSLTVGYVFWSGPSADLKFRPLSYPQGFRELKIESTYSRFDPFIGLKINNARNASRSEVLNICERLFQDSTSPVYGNTNAKISIVEFFDYRCAYCKKLSTALKQLQKNDDRVRIIYKEWPILGEASELAARAALASAKQGRYLEVHYRLMRSGLIPTTGYIEAIAADLGLDISRLRRDMKSSETTRAIDRTSILAKNLGFIGTPSLVIGRTIVQGAISKAQLEALVRIEIDSASTAPCRTVGSS